MSSGELGGDKGKKNSRIKQKLLRQEGVKI